MANWIGPCLAWPRPQLRVPDRATPARSDDRAGIAVGSGLVIVPVHRVSHLGDGLAQAYVQGTEPLQACLYKVPMGMAADGILGERDSYNWKIEKPAAPSRIRLILMVET
jgi:hypothetical protein